MQHKQKVKRHGRILALDLLRGYFLIVLILDHLGYFPSIYEFISGRGLLWASAAEGFFMISGLLVGYIYGPKMHINKRAVSIKIWKRASQLYFWSLILTYASMAWGSVAKNALFIKPGLWTNPDPLEFAYKTLTLQYSYGWGDFLQYYVLFMILAPIAVYLCTRNKAWVVVLASSLVWLVRGKHFVMSLQIIFMFGLVAGYYLPQIETAFKGLTKTVQYRIKAALYAATAITITLSALTVRVSEAFLKLYRGSDQFPAIVMIIFYRLDDFHNFTRPLVDKFTLAPLRLAMSLLWFTAFYMFFRSHEQDINRWTRGVLKNMGEASLFVYALHALVVYGMLQIWLVHRSFLLNTVMTTIVLVFIYGVTYYRNLFITGFRGLGCNHAGKPHPNREKNTGLKEEA